MTVYVDDMYKYPAGKFHRMKMSHMVADTEKELHAMAKSVGVARRHFQGDHYDICLSMRNKAVKFGAVEVTWPQLGAMLMYKRKKGTLPTPEKADAWRSKIISKFTSK